MTLNVLIVDDDDATLELMTEVLTSLGANVCALGDSNQAASLVNQEPFAGIFLDLQMSGLNGFELARKVRQSAKNRFTPIVIVTGSTDTKAMQDAFAAGSTFYIEKPVDRPKLRRLFNSVRGALSRHDKLSARSA